MLVPRSDLGPNAHTQVVEGAPVPPDVLAAHAALEATTPAPSLDAGSDLGFANPA